MSRNRQNGNGSIRQNGKLTVALPKGRLLDSAVDFLNEVGMNTASINGKGNDRRLVFQDDATAPNYIVVKPYDVVQFVYHGAADLGIVGNDVLREQELPVFEPLDLKFGRCRLVLAGTPAFKSESANVEAFGAGYSKDFVRLKIATCYPHICKTWAESKNLDVEIRSLNGSVEIAPITGFADLIMDLVDSGETLKQNGLQEITTILDISARLIVNRAALKTRPELASLVRLMKKHIRPEKRRRNGS